MAYAGGLVILILDHTWRNPHGRQVWEGYFQICIQAKRAIPPNALLLGPFARAARLIAERAAEPQEDDYLGIEGKGPARRPVYVISPRVSELHGLGTAPDLAKLPGDPVEVLSNRFFVLYRLTPVEPER